MQKLFETRRDRFLISTDPARLDLDAIADMLTRAYWATGRSRERTERALQNSLVFGVYDGVKQIGLARVVTDYAIFAIVRRIHSGRLSYKVLGKWLMETVLTIGCCRGCVAGRLPRGMHTSFTGATVSTP
jgi:hypothetical protein